MIEVNADGLIASRTFENFITYVYDSEGKLIKKKETPNEGVPQTTYYEYPENGNSVVKFRAGDQAVTSHSKTDSFGRIGGIIGGVIGAILGPYIAKSLKHIIQVINFGIKKHLMMLLKLPARRKSLPFHLNTCLMLAGVMRSLQLQNGLKYNLGFHKL